MAKCRYDWVAVQAYYDQGHDRNSCMRRFGFTIGAWYYAIYDGRLRLSPADEALRKRRACRGNEIFDWREIQAFYAAGHTYTECRIRFGFSPAAWDKAKRRGQVVVRPRARSAAETLAKSRSRFSVKRALLREGLLENRCAECGLTEWRGQPITIQIDHRNGVRDDHRLDNLRMLCPNCHSQTETFAARNRRTRRHAQGVSFFLYP
jgi:hypothetical protein